MLLFIVGLAIAQGVAIAFCLALCRVAAAADRDAAAAAEAIHRSILADQGASQ